MSDSYEDFISHLEDREYFGQKLGLERVEAILKKLGDPQKKFSSIHVAGTNGKGSTVTMIAALLKQAGARVGVYTSPHLIDFCERIRVGDELIRPQQVMRILKNIQSVETEKLTFFELATVMAFLFFEEMNIDYAVIETGLGGRLDATNVIQPLVSVITSIGLDHVQFLGETRAQIAFEKAGIIKDKTTVVLGEIPEEAREVILEVAKKKNAPVVEVKRSDWPEVWSLGLSGEHQKMNAALALQAIRLLRQEVRQEVMQRANQQELVQLSEEKIREAFKNVFWPGRLQTILQKPWVLLDGAHNSEAMNVLIKYLRQNLSGRKLKIIFGVMLDKDIEDLLKQMSELTTEIVFVPPPLKRAASPEKLTEIGKKYFEKIDHFVSLQNALETLLPKLHPDKEVLLITGSLFLVGEAQKWFSKNTSSF